MTVCSVFLYIYRPRELLYTSLSSPPPPSLSIKDSWGFAEGTETPHSPHSAFVARRAEQAVLFVEAREMPRFVCALNEADYKD